MTTFRDATAADLAAVADLVNSAYRGDSSRAGWTTEADLLGGQRTDAEALAEEFATVPGLRMVLAHDDDALVGCVRLEPGENHGHPDALYVGMVTVDPVRQAGGYGRALLDEAERRAVAEGRRAAVMTVISVRDALIAWYGRRGYEPTGEREAFPYGDERFGIPKREDLEFVVLRKPLA